MEKGSSETLSQDRPQPSSLWLPFRHVLRVYPRALVNAGYIIGRGGFAIKESFLNSQLAAEIQLLDVLARTPMRLMHAILSGMARLTGISPGIS